MNRTFKPNRRGITLLFVISMIVLFLLMGTAFIIVANNFSRDSNDRILTNQTEGKGVDNGHAIVEKTMYQLIRGVDLRNIDSPLRVNDYLSDQYGFGVKSYVAGNVAPQTVAGGTFVEITLTSNPGTTRADWAASTSDDLGFNLLTLSPTAVPLTSSSLRDFYGGQVLSFTSGAAKGFSARIYSDYFDASGNHIFRIPASSVSGDIITATTAGNLAGSEVIINGRDFGGTGANVLLDPNSNPLNLAAQSLLPNRVGQSHSGLIGATGSAPYLTSTFLDSSGVLQPPIPRAASVNEPWDAADVGTMFLSGHDKSGEIIASFHRQALMDNSTSASTFASGRTFFHAFDADNDGMPDVNCTGTGEKDSYWMDLGSAIITNREGKRFKPLVAIHVKDLSGLLNVNVHGNRTHLLTDGYVNQQQTWADSEPQSPLGLGMGPADINLTQAIGSTAQLARLFNERYSGDGTGAGVDQLPGDGTTSFRSRAKLFGSPSAEINPGGNEFGTIGRLYGTTMDIHGRFRYGTPSSSNSGFDSFVDLNFPNFNNALPQINMLSSQDIDTFNDEFSGNPYEMSISGKVTGDNPFTPEELERVYRSNDLDTSVLPNRLSNIVGSRKFFTTDSFDVPMLSRNFNDELRFNILKRNTSFTNFSQIDPLISTFSFQNQFAFAPELYRGQKMDPNRPFGDGIDNNNNGVVDEPGEEVAAKNTDAAGVFGTGDETNMDLNYDGTRDATDAGVGVADASLAATPRVIYARHLYMLAMLLMEPVDMNKDGALVDTSDPTIAEADPERLAYARAIAQWAVNVVDFRDADSIHTKFAYDPFPWDAGGWNPPLDAADADGGRHPTFFVWGCERPELLLTETLAVHIQNRQKKAGGDPNMPVYEQRLRPEPFAYFEVTNPWTQNRLNQQLDSSLYTRFGVDLGRLAPDKSPVWRFEVERAENAAAAGTPTVYKPLRYVYMTDPTDAAITYENPDENQVPGDIEIFFNSGGRTLLRPGRQALIGTQGFQDPDDNRTYKVFMGRKTTAIDDGTPEELLLDDTTRLEVRAGNLVNPGTVTRFTGDTQDSVRSAAIVFVDKATTATAGGAGELRKFSLSDQYEGYPGPDSTPAATGKELGDGFKYDTVYPDSLDQADGDRITDEDIAMIRIRDGISRDFRYVRLQRLANPLIAWDADTNPYLTIDSMEVDLISINGADSEDGSLPATGQTSAVSHERGDHTSSANARNQLWGFMRQAAIRGPEGVGTSDDHYFASAFDESLGRTNDSFDPTVAGSPFPWLSWNNRPFVSHTEIMNVPYLAPDRLTYAPLPTAESTDYPTQPFTVDTTAAGYDPFTQTRNGALSGRYGHLLNFFAAEDDTTNMFADAYKLLDFIEVPSRFAGDESYYLADGVANVFRHPFNTISRYRAPGRVNVNMIPPNAAGSTLSTVWSAVVGEYQPGSGAQISWAALKNSLYGTYAAGTGPTGPTDFENPFRPASAANLLPGQTNAIAPSACTLMRPQQIGTSPQVPLFDYQSTLESDNTNRNAAFRNSVRTRLGNLVTNKSSVFACWITVGYFEVDQNDNLVDINGTPIVTDPTMVPTTAAAEVDADIGEQVRNRGFFIFDRSIPVAFEPGKNHNVDKAILLKSLLE